MRSNFDVIRRDRELYEMWSTALLVPFLLSLPKAGMWFFWVATLLRGWLLTALLARAASGKVWGRVVFGLLLAFEVAISGALTMRSQLPMSDRITQGISALVMAYVAARAFRLVGAARAPNGAQQL